jgi:hypothetical protein
MKTSLFQLLTVFSAASFSTAALAIHVSVEDISNKVLTCDSPLLTGQPSGTCIAASAATLWITVTLEDGDNPNSLDNVHIVVQSNGHTFQYSPWSSDATQLWSEFSVNGLMVTTPIVASFQRAAFDSKDSVSRQVHLGDFYSQKGSKVYIAVRANASAGFTSDSIKEVFEVL